MVDDYSRYTLVKFLASKDEVAQEIIDHIMTLERNPKHRVQFLRSDNGSEFKKATLHDYCKKLRIIQQFSAARTPQ